MRVLFITALAVVVVVVTASTFVNAECHVTYEGLCPGPSSCRCSIHEKCGGATGKDDDTKQSCTGTNKTRAMNALGGCSGRCRTVTLDRCAGNANCLLVGDDCGGSPPGPAPGPSPSPTRDHIIKVAKEWCDQRVPYCQCNGPAECCGTCSFSGRDMCSAGYRCDCSGYVSYCIGLDRGYTTMTLPEVAHEIKKHELKKGDMMLYVQDHVVLFGGWSDSSRTHYLGYQEPGCHVAGPHYAFSSVIPYPMNWNPQDFKPYRKNGLGSSDSPADQFASDEDIKAALRHRPSYPFKYEAEALKNYEKSRNHTEGLMMRVFGKIIDQI